MFRIMTSVVKQRMTYGWRLLACLSLSDISPSHRGQDFSSWGLLLFNIGEVVLGFILMTLFLNHSNLYSIIMVRKPCFIDSRIFISWIAIVHYSAEIVKMYLPFQTSMISAVKMNVFNKFQQLYIAYKLLLIQNYNESLLCDTYKEFGFMCC